MQLDKTDQIRAAGHSMYMMAEELWPICRSITGNGVRKSLKILEKQLPNLTLHEVATGIKCFDWEVPKEWNITDAYITDPDGNKFADFKENNLHIVGYSTPINTTLSLEELNKHLYSLPEQPNAIPYITSYYKERWGFCITENERRSLKEGPYKVVVESELVNGFLTYGELLIKGTSDKEIFLSTYICHPSMANNELSGPVVTSHIAKWLNQCKDNRYTYRIIFIPETIGSICYLSLNLAVMKQNIEAGFNISCVGDNRTYSYLPSRAGDTFSDRIIKHVLKQLHGEFTEYTYLDRGSDERQYCSPGVDLPIATLMRSKYGEYPEYHTSLDNLELISSEGLSGAFEALQLCIYCLENNYYYKVNVFGEPQLGKRGLYPTISTKASGSTVRTMMNFIAYADGTRSLLDIAEIINTPIWKLIPIARKLQQEGLLNSSKTGT